MTATTTTIDRIRMMFSSRASSGSTSSAKEDEEEDMGDIVVVDVTLGLTDVVEVIKGIVEMAVEIAEVDVMGGDDVDEVDEFPDTDVVDGLVEGDADEGEDGGICETVDGTDDDEVVAGRGDSAVEDANSVIEFVIAGNVVREGVCPSFVTETRSICVV